MLGQRLLIAYEYPASPLLQWQNSDLIWGGLCPAVISMMSSPNDGHTLEHLCHHHPSLVAFWSGPHSMETTYPSDHAAAAHPLVQKSQKSMLAPSASTPWHPGTPAQWVSRASRPFSYSAMETVLESKLSIYKSLNSIIHLYCVYTGICYLDWITNDHL